MKDVQILPGTLHQVHQFGPRHKFYQLAGEPGTGQDSCVQHVLKGPGSVWDGTRRFSQGGRCYAGNPPVNWNNEGERVEPPEKMLFTVYVDQYGNAYEWGWEPQDAANPGWPLDHGESRFIRGLLWPKNS